MSAQIEVQSVSHQFVDGMAGLLDVDLEVGAGERLAISGRMGAGKTTLLRHLNGLLRPTGGRVLLEGSDIAGEHVACIARRVGLVFQDPDRQLFTRTVADEAAFGARNIGLEGHELRAAVAEALDWTGLAPVGGTHPFDLGYSRRKLVALAAVLAMRTKVLVVDEPSAGQDLRGVAVVESVFSRLHALGRTLIFSGHDAKFVQRNADRTVHLEAGRV